MLLWSGSWSWSRPNEFLPGMPRDADKILFGDSEDISYNQVQGADSVESS